MAASQPSSLGAEGQRQVEVATEPGAAAPLFRVARRTRGSSDRDRHARRRTARRRATRKCPACRCRDGCRYRAPPRAAPRRAQMLRGQRGIVQIAMPAHPRRIGVMTRRTGQRVGAAALGRFVRGGEGAAGGGQRGRPGSGRDRAGRIETVPAKRPMMLLLGRAPSACISGVGCTFGTSSGPCSGRASQASVASRRKSRKSGVCTRFQRGPLRRLRPHNIEPHAAARLQQRVGTGGDFEMRTQRAALQEEAWRVLELDRIPECLHGGRLGSGDHPVTRALPAPPRRLAARHHAIEDKALSASPR